MAAGNAVSRGDHATMAVDAALAGTALADRFDILEEIGRGGMGVVYKARDRKLGRLVALKRVQETGQESRHALARFWKEARAIASLDHANIVRVYDVVEEAAGAFIVMEYVAGGDLAARLAQDGALPAADVCALGQQLCDGLALAHEQGIIHRDIKPGNVLLAPDGTPKLGDFGLAHEVQADVSLTQTGAVLGTVEYAAPEQLMSGKEVDERTDLYSLGALLYAAATGNSPRMVRLDRVPAGLREVVGRCLEHEPAGRYQTATEVHAALGNSVDIPHTDEAACPECGFNNPVDVRFCQQCGTSLESLFQKCPNCGRENRVDVVFCGGCGVDMRPSLVEARRQEEAEEAIRRQRETAPNGEVERTIELADGVNLELVWIPPGEFTMGSRESRVEHVDSQLTVGVLRRLGIDLERRSDDEGPQRRVEITRGFWMGKYPVVQDQWDLLMWRNPSDFKGGMHPVENVSFAACEKFLERLKKKVPDANFRLPSEAEWEYACLTGMDTRYSYGDRIEALTKYGWYRKNSEHKTHPVGERLPNAWGLHDMHGNVWEWCQDWYHPHFYRSTECRDPVNSKKSFWLFFFSGVPNTHVSRGGSCDDHAADCQGTSRGSHDRRLGSHGIGFRVVLFSGLRSS